MSNRYPYPRYYRLKEEGTFRFRVRIWWLKTRVRFMHRWQAFKWSRLGGAQRYVEQNYPIVPFSVSTGEPVVPDKVKTYGCRTVHGPATMQWSWYYVSSGETKSLSVTAQEAQNVLLPDGTRGTAGARLSGWQRRATPPILRTWGRIDITADDVVFHDNAKQPSYEPPQLNSNQHLERELATSREFIAALTNDYFAVVAFRNLATGT